MLSCGVSSLALALQLGPSGFLSDGMTLELNKDLGVFLAPESRQ